MIVAEINYLDESNVARVALFCNGRGFTTGPSDTPANTVCAPYLTNAGYFQRDMFAGQAVAGAIKAGQGMLELTNMGGKLSAWAGYAVDGRALTLRIGDEGSSYPSGFTTLIAGATMERLEMDRRVMRIFLRDRLADYDKPMCTQIYAGTGTTEGPSSFAGRRKPKLYGVIYNGQPVLVDTSLVLYQMSSSYESSTVDQNVRDGGVTLSNGSAYPDLATLLSTAPSAGQVRHYAAAGMFRAGSASVYEITADRKGHDAATSVASKLVERMALDAGTSSGDIDTVSSLGLTSGYYSEGDETTFLTAMQAIAEGSGLWFGWSRLGKLQIGQLTDPASGSSTATYIRHQLKELSRSAPPGFEVPIQRVRMRYQRNWHPMSTFAGSVTLADKERLGRQWSEIESADTSIATRHPYAGDFTRNSYACDLFGYTGPSAECTRILDLHKADRAILRTSIDLSAANVGPDLGTVLTIQTPEFGLSAGKKFVVVSHRIDMKSRRIQLGLWG